MQTAIEILSETETSLLLSDDQKYYHQLNSIENQASSMNIEISTHDKNKMKTLNQTETVLLLSNNHELNSIENKTNSTTIEISSNEKNGKIFQKQKIPSILRRLISLTSKNIKDVIIANIIIIIVTSIEIVIPYLCGKMLDMINLNSNHDKIDELGILILLLVLGNTLFVYIKSYYNTIMEERVVCDFRIDLFSSLMRKDIEFYERKKIGELMSRLISDTILVQAISNSKITSIIKYSIKSIGSLILLANISIELTTYFMILLPVILVFMSKYSYFLKNLSKSYQAQVGECSVVANEALSNIRVIKSFSNEVKEETAYNKKIENTYLLGKKKASLDGLFRSFTTLLSKGTILFVLWYGGKMVFLGKMTAGHLTSFVLYTFTLSSSAIGFSDTINKMIDATGACERVFDILDHKSNINYDGGKTLLSKDWNIKFENVYFRYPCSENILIFNNLNLTINASEKVAIVGTSGSGKTSLVALLERFYDVKSGEIIINGLNIKDIDPKCLHSNIGYVSQESSLFSGTIQENITYGNQNYTSQQLDDVLKQANVYEFIHDKVMFPAGLKTIVGEKGVRLSGGQKQRISIARALMINPKILIFDEATSALDAESESQVQQAIDNLTEGSQMTLIIIAHRLSTIVKCPRIVVMQKGQIIEEGNHKELMVRKGIYNMLIETQIHEHMI